MQNSETVKDVKVNNYGNCFHVKSECDSAESTTKIVPETCI